MTLVPWKQSQQLLWDLVVVDALAPSRLNAVSVGKLGIAEAESEEKRMTSMKVLLKKVICFSL